MSPFARVFADLLRPENVSQWERLYYLFGGTTIVNDKAGLLVNTWWRAWLNPFPQHAYMGQEITWWDRVLLYPKVRRMFRCVTARDLVRKVCPPSEVVR